MNQEILDEALRHFVMEGRRYEYGRDDKSMDNNSPNGRTDPSRTEQDLDGDGRLGVDCSSLVWRGLKNAGYDVGDSPFTTSKLFEGHQITDYSKKHFDVISADAAQQTHGALQPGDILMFRSRHGDGQHVAIFQGYDAQGRIRFFGSQTSTGPATVEGDRTRPGAYWNGGDFEIVGALRAKPEFQVREPLHGRDEPLPPEVRNGTHRPASASNAQAPKDSAPTLSREAIGALQTQLNALGYRDERGQALEVDHALGKHTRAAIEAFQRAQGLPANGQANPETLNKLRELSQKHEQAPPVQPEKTPSSKETKQPSPHDPVQKKPADASDPTTLLNNPAHSDSPLFKEALKAVQQMDAQYGRTSDKRSEQLAAALVVAARQNGLQHIDHVMPSKDGAKVFAMEGSLNSPFKETVEVKTAEALSTSIAQSTRAWNQAAQKNLQPIEQPLQERLLPVAPSI